MNTEEEKRRCSLVIGMAAASASHIGGSATAPGGINGGLLPPRGVSLSSIPGHHHTSLAAFTPAVGGERRTDVMLRRAVGACTESLGSDSGDVGGYADAELISLLCRPPPAAAGDGAAAAAEECDEEEDAPAPEEEEAPRRRGLFPFPPVMARAAEALVMRAERRGGRLILTEVRGAELERREVFRASRDGGRLRLRFAAGTHPAAREPAAQETAAAAASAAVQRSGEFCQVAAAGRGRVEVVGAVVGI